MRLFIRFKLILILSVVINLTAFAQYDASATLSLGMGHGYNALSQSVMSNAFKNSGSNTISKSSNADYIYLGASNYSRFEEKIAKSLMAGNKNNDQNKIRSFLSSTRTMYHFNTKSRVYGLKNTYLSDILATGIAWNWEMYHQTKADNKKVINLRNTIRNNMAKGPVKDQLAKLSEDQRREWILSFMYNHSMLAQTIKQSGKLSATHKQQLAEMAKNAGVPNIATVSL
ncbi:MAG: hypothetical protein EOO86_16410 [Pedobacter sp.]|nr:MAG: hypothetical protein EOO86_16410 [Pedobacter sp.]